MGQQGAGEIRRDEGGDDVYIMSYLAASGYTLTVALNFRDRTVAGFASSAKDWQPVRGTLEVVGG